MSDNMKLRIFLDYVEENAPEFIVSSDEIKNHIKKFDTAQQIRDAAKLYIIGCNYVSRGMF